ncbi:hypothetical protein VNO80_30369 [Phaseolus coccineus]|uniref:Uncharacterized protein n=1 Tax=Phaseolus coccineus TaxID=3886 RepID=A0AAN9LG58_PHACN
MLLYALHTHKSKLSIFRLRVNLEMVLLRLAESVCDHPVRLFHMEHSAQRDNMDYFNLGKVRVVVDGTSQQTQSKGAPNLACLHLHTTFSPRPKGFKETNGTPYNTSPFLSVILKKA